MDFIVFKHLECTIGGRNGSLLDAWVKKYAWNGSWIDLKTFDLVKVEGDAKYGLSLNWWLLREVEFTPKGWSNNLMAL